jgi:hypothetical protein
MSPAKPILEDKHCDACNEVLQAIPKIQELLDRCKSCGLDVTEFQAQLDNQNAMATAIKREFFPQRT